LGCSKKAKNCEGLTPVQQFNANRAYWSRVTRIGR